MRVRLEVIGGPETGRVFVLDGADTFLIGRSPKAHLVLDPLADRYISRAHALIDVRPPSCHATDLDSTNGTYVNEGRIRRLELRDGDELRLGRTRIRVRLEQVSPDLVETVEIRRPAQRADRDAVVVTAGGDRALHDADRDLAEAGEHTCSVCARDLARWAEAAATTRPACDSLYLCPTCAAAERRSDLPIERIWQYQVLDVIGRGGMGVVLKVVDERTRRLCAIKQIRPEAARDARALMLFDREIGIQCSILHPNLVRIFERGQEAGCCFFVAELLGGGDLEHLVREVFRGPLAPGPACRIILDVLAGVEALHAQGFVHRDLKPSNMVLSRPYGEPGSVAKVTDYGLAKSFEEAGNSLFDYTRAGEAGGSIMFMPPEQILEYRFVKPPADVYAIGVSLYYLLTGRYTVEFPTPEELAAGVARRASPIEIMLEEPPIPVLKRRPNLPGALAAVVDRAVQKERAQRYASAADLRMDLERACSTGGV